MMSEVEELRQRVIDLELANNKLMDAMECLAELLEYQRRSTVFDRCSPIHRVIDNVKQLGHFRPNLAKLLGKR